MNTRGPASNIVDVLRRRAAEAPHQVGYNFLSNGISVVGSLTYSELDLRARALAALLRTRVEPGARALLLFPPGLEFIEAYFGCLYAGVIAVPGYPPQGSRLDSRMSVICTDAGAQVALVPAALRETMEVQFAALGLGAIECISPPGPDAGTAARWAEPVIELDSMAHLQYTSGSTSAPKGVMVSHGNLMHNCASFQAVVPIDDGGSIVTWLPTFHDMGLVYGVLVPLVRGVPGYGMAPLEFVQRPMRWLQAMSHFEATHSVGPNFAFDLCVRRAKPEDIETLNLTHWQVALNGAEPVRQPTLDAFVAAFEPAGFRRETFCPGFGLAECTLLVGATVRGALSVAKTVQLAALEQHRVVAGTEGSRESRTLVSLGPPAPDTILAIVNPDTHERSGPDEIGELWISSPSVALGYWNLPEQTAAAFGAEIADEPGRRFLRTGDLAFIEDGLLYIAGRAKDLIIVRGENHYPEDIELTVERAHAELRPAGGAAFSVEVDGEERLVIVHELKTPFADLDDVRTAVRQRVAEEHEIAVHDLHFIRPGALLRTSSGKLQRQANRAAYLAGSFEPVVATPEPAGERSPSRPE